VNESRFALDFRLDAVVGLWVETMASRVQMPGLQSDNVTAMAGVDYTFGIGNGLYASLETLTAHSGEFGDELSWKLHSTAIMANYTLGLEDGLMAYLYAINTPDDETKFIPTLGWQHTQGNWLFYLALYDMPEFSTAETLGFPEGTGLQINIAVNH